MKKSLYLTAALTLIMWSCTTQKESTSNAIVVKNSSEVQRTEVVKVDLTSSEPTIDPGLGTVGSLPAEAVDENGDGTADFLLAKVAIAPSDSVSLDLSTWTLDPSATNPTQAEISVARGGEWKEREYLGGTSFENVDFLSVPKSHTDHSWYIRYEGPGWENEMIGYRFYLDWRNAADIFGKKVDTLVLQAVGQDGFDSYHEKEDWGMDILKAGQSLGIGSIGRVGESGEVEHFEQTDSVTCQIVKNGGLSSIIETNYYGWETTAGICDLKSKLTINSGDRATIHTVSFGQEVDNFCTGIVKHPEGEFFESSAGYWGYIATYGAQTLFDDNLGMAIFYKLDQLQKIDTADTHNQLLVFKPSTSVEYQFLGAWEKEPGGIKTQEGFKAYLDRKLQALNNPLEILP